MARPKDPNNTLHKTCPTCKQPFTCERRKEKTYCCKKCAVNDPAVKEKNRIGVAKAFDSKYGGHPMAVNPQTKEKLTLTMIERHGKAWFSQTDEFVDKTKATKLERYGDERYNNIDQMKQTCLERYGADNYKKTDECRKKYEETCLKKYGVPHASMQGDRKEQINSSTFKQSHKKAMFKKFIESERFKNFTPCFSIDEYDGITVQFNKKYTFKCNRCNKEQDFDLTRYALRCSVCDASMSIFQTEIVDYVKQLLPSEPIVINNRAVLSPLELDIYIPGKNIAIEADGIYYHSEVSGTRNKNYHLNKTKLCAMKGIRLVHIFENDWNHCKNIVKSILKTLLLKENRIIYARKCSIKEIDPIQKSEFLEQNSLHGNDTAMIRLGLFDEDRLIAAMTFSSSKFTEKEHWEISRYCSLLGVTVVGGMSKLFSYFIKHFKPEIVAAYTDRRYFSGESFLKLGFTFVENLAPDYQYIIESYDVLENNVNWQKAKLEKKLTFFDPALSEWENMKVNGFDRIWDCGHSKWIWVDKSQKPSTVQIP
jgi:hypothetical protein